jgi:hypothetical protein
VITQEGIDEMRVTSSPITFTKCNRRLVGGSTGGGEVVGAGLESTGA